MSKDRKVKEDDTPALELDPRILLMIELAKGEDARRQEPPPAPGAAVDASAPATKAPAAPDEGAARAALDDILRRAILHARRSGSLSQTDIALRLGVSASMVSNWVRGHRPITDRYLPELARILNIDLHRAMLDGVLTSSRQPSDEDLELARLIAGLNDEAKAPLLRLLKRLQG